MAQRFRDLTPAHQAGLLCKQADFQRFAASRLHLPQASCQESVAAEYLRHQCRITSRRDLNTSAEARERFERLRTDFDAWRGRIGRP